MRGSFASHPPTCRKRKRGAAGGPRRNPRARGSSRLSGSPLEPLQKEMSNRSVSRRDSKSKCSAPTPENWTLDPRECGAVLAADAVNERAKEIFTLPTAAHFHCEKIPSIRFLIRKNRFNHLEETGAPSRGARKCINERAAWKRSCQTTQKATKTPSIVLARQKAEYCEVNLCQFVDAKVVTIELVIVHCAIDC